MVPGGEDDPAHSRANMWCTCRELRIHASIYCLALDACTHVHAPMGLDRRYRGCSRAQTSGTCRACLYRSTGRSLRQLQATDGIQQLHSP